MSETQETHEQYEHRIRDAKAAHERRLEGAKIHASQIQVFASDAMKAPALVALGGVVALLGFYSANFSRLSENPIAMDAFGKMLFWLFTCLVLTVAAPGLAYLSQIAYTQALYDEEHKFEWPYIRSTGWSKFYGRIGDTFRWLAVALRPVEIHREFITAAARWMMALKLWSVLSARMAIRLNSLSLQKKFSIR